MRGSKRERSPRVWELRVWLGRDPYTGRPRYKSRTFRGSARGADAALSALVAEVTQGRYADTEGTVAYLFERWIEHCTYRGLARWTIAGYRSKSKVIVAGLGEQRLDRLSPAHLDAFYAACLKRGTSAAMVRKYHVILSTALGQAVRWQWIAVNPAKLATAPAHRRPALTIPDPDDVRRLLAAAPGDLALFLRLAATTGARRGELCGLRVEDYDGSSLTIARSVSDAGSVVEVKATKTHQTRRIPIDAATAALIDAHLDGVAGGFIFSRDPDHARPWRPVTVSHAFDRLRRRLQIPCRLHDLRHFVATQLLASGYEGRVVADRLGHASTRMTYDTYGHLVERRAVEAGETIAEVIKDT